MINLKRIYNTILEGSNLQYKIYCDMDGVLCDFEQRFMKYSEGIPPREYELKYGKEKFWDLIDVQTGLRFWVGMSWMPGGKELWDYIKPYNPTLLSSPSYNNASRLGKRLWVRNNLPGTKLILANRANKVNYSEENSILIDDMPRTIKEWDSGGGIGILHTSANSTIDKLKQLGL